MAQRLPPARGTQRATARIENDTTVSHGVTRRTEYEYDTYGNRSIVRDALDRELNYEYDEFGRITAIVYHDDSRTETTYDGFGNILTETSAMGLVKEYEYDSLGRLTAVELPEVYDPQSQTNVSPRYEYEYDTFGNRTVIRDPLGRETLYTYDEQGRQLSRTLPLGQTETFEYDERGRQVRHVDMEGRIIDSLFSDDGFLDELLYHAAGSNPDADSPDDTVAYDYNAEGRRTSTTDDRGTTEYVYDLDGNVTQIDSPEGILNYEYDDTTGRLLRTFGSVASDPNDPVHDFEYTYDGFGRLKTVSAIERNDVTLVTSEVTIYSYDLIGNLIRVDLPNGVITTYDYDELYRLELLTHYAPDETPLNLADNDKLASYEYTVRADGKRTGVVETRWASQAPLVTLINWTYDNLGRLVQEIFDGHNNELDFTSEYTYDLTGNRLKKTVDKGSNSTIDEFVTYEYDANDRLLVEEADVDGDTDVDRTTTYSYQGTQLALTTVIDVATSQTIETTANTYNLQGRLAEAVVTKYTGGVASQRETSRYVYNADGMRTGVEREVDSNADGTPESVTQSVSLVDGNNHTGYEQVLTETVYDDASTPNVLSERVFAIGLDQISQTTVDSQETQTLVLLTDGKGSTSLIVDATAVVLAHYAYDAHGNLLDESQPLLTNLLYNGEALDSTTGNYNFRGRDYDPRVALFPTYDPFVGNFNDPQSLHKYAFVHGDPINGIDPSGRSLISAFGGAIGTITLRVTNIGVRIMPALAFVFWTMQFWSHRILTILPAIEYRLMQFGVLTTFLDGATEAWLNNTEEFPDGTLGERTARGRRLEGATQANIGGNNDNFPIIDDIRRGDGAVVGTSVKTHSVGSGQKLLNAIEKDLQQLSRLDTENHTGTDRDGNRLHIRRGEVTHKVLDVGIPKNTETYLTPAFRASLTTLAEKYRSMIRIVPIPKWIRR